MIDKSMYAILFMYSVSFSVLAGQYMLGDIYGITIRNWQGDEMKSNLLTFIQTNQLNTVTANIANATDAQNSSLAAIENAFQVGFNVGVELVTILTGTYIFNVVYFFLGPDSAIIIAGLVILYAFLVGRTLIALIRGV